MAWYIGSPQVEILLGTGDGGFVVGPGLGSPGGVLQATVGDFNGDGVADLVSVESFSSVVSEWFGSLAKVSQTALFEATVPGGGIHRVLADYHGTATLENSSSNFVSVAGTKIPTKTALEVTSIQATSSEGAAGLSLQQTFTVNMIKDGKNVALSNGRPLIAVPSNVGPRTMPDYDALAAQGIYHLDGEGIFGIRVWAGTAADPFFIDLGATFDSLNYRAGTGVEALTPAQDADDQMNSAPNSVAGFNVNTIAIEGRTIGACQNR